MAERLKALVSKTSIGETQSGVRISLSPHIQQMSALLGAIFVCREKKANCLAFAGDSKDFSLSSLRDRKVPGYVVAESPFSPILTKVEFSAFSAIVYELRG